MVTVIATGFSSEISDEAEEEEEDKTIYDLDSSQPIKDDKKNEPEYPPENKTVEQPRKPQERDDMPPREKPPGQNHKQENGEGEHPEISSSRRYLLMKEADERKRRLKGRKSIASPDNSEDVFKNEDFYNEPAYVRKHVHLYNAPAHDDRNVSRYSLDDDDNIIGNNKFLHDNVD